MKIEYDAPWVWGAGAAIAAFVGAVLGFVGYKIATRIELEPIKKVKTRAYRNALLQWGKLAEDVLRWPELHDFLDVVALGESGWNLRPYNEVAVPGSNDAVGPYQIRPTSSGDGKAWRDYYRADPSKLQDAGVATVAIVDFFADNLRGSPYATWEELRASAAFPFFVRGRPTRVPEAMQKSWSLASLQKRYDDSINRFRIHRGQAGSGLNPKARAWAGPKAVDFGQLARSMKVQT